MSSNRPRMSDKEEQNFLRHLGNHLVSLSGVAVPLDAKREPCGKGEAFAYSGFILSIRDIWHIVTAGHILKPLNEGLKKERIRLRSCWINDCFGTGVKVQQPTQFIYDAARTAFVFDDAKGLDFGLIQLRPYYRDHLEANGIRPFTRVDWELIDDIDFDCFGIVGLPTALQVRTATEIGMCPVFLPVDIPSDLPEDIPQTEYPRFVGRLRSKPGYSIVGTSGGPIFGFFRSEDWQIGYTIVAVQSGWFERSGIVFGCPVALFGRAIEKEIHEIERERGILAADPRAP